MNKHVVEVISEAASEGVSQLSKQELLLRHSHQLVMSYGRENSLHLTRMGDGSSSIYTIGIHINCINLVNQKNMGPMAL